MNKYVHQKKLESFRSIQSTTLNLTNTLSKDLCTCKLQNLQKALLYFWFLLFLWIALLMSALVLSTATKLYLFFVFFFHSSRMLISFTKQENAPDWWGYSLAFLMFFTAILQTLILHRHFQYCFVTGMNVRTAVIGAIYRKVQIALCSVLFFTQHI